jgi:hypothetical protein
MIQSIRSESANDDGQLVDEKKTMRSRWNEEVEITMEGGLLNRMSLRAASSTSMASFISTEETF